MWSEAFELLAKAERLHQQFFEPRPSSHVPSWAPPADVLETAGEVLVFVALPGVSPTRVDVAIEGASLVLSGVRVLPAELAVATIHRLELPQGRFERRIPIPPGRYNDVRRDSVDGCLVISLTKAGSAP
jgi:HSP20 family molecular chaperone IbpA